MSRENRHHGLILSQRSIETARITLIAVRKQFLRLSIRFGMDFRRSRMGLIMRSELLAAQPITVCARLRRSRTYIGLSIDSYARLAQFFLQARFGKRFANLERFFHVARSGIDVAEQNPRCGQDIVRLREELLYAFEHVLTEINVLHLASTGHQGH